MFENGWWEYTYPHPTPLDLPLSISYKNHPKNLAYFSHLAPLVLFLFTKSSGGHSLLFEVTKLPLQLRVKNCD